MFKCSYRKSNFNHKPYEKMLKVLKKLLKKLNFKFEYIDLGGGMGIDYQKIIKNLIIKNIILQYQKILKK